MTDLKTFQGYQGITGEIIFDPSWNDIGPIWMTEVRNGKFEFFPPPPLTSVYISKYRIMETYKGDNPDKYGRSIPIWSIARPAQKNTIINVNGIEIGGNEIVIIAGPCAVENREQLLETAKAVRLAGANILRGGAYKPRTSPYSFQGLGEEGLRYLSQARKETGLTSRYRGNGYTADGTGL